MLSVEIRRPCFQDLPGLTRFFQEVITDTFLKEGIGDKLDDIHHEIKVKENYLKSDLESNGQNRYFLIALDGNKIIGSIEYGPASELIRKCIHHAYKDLLEVGTVFVAPNYQKRGVGNQLLNAMLTTLQNKGIKEFCLDSGYKRAQEIWRKKFGEPDYVLKDYWGPGFDHMVWKIIL